VSIYKVRSMKVAAFALAMGCPFPEVVEENHRNIFVFSDNDGTAEAACKEYLQDDPQGVGAQVSAPRLFEAWNALKTALPPREKR
jgi:hypothetical protein